jgi:hypothetical protein
MIGHPSSDIAGLMRSTYMNCQREFGKSILLLGGINSLQNTNRLGRGSDSRRKSHVHRRVANHLLFRDIRDAVRTSHMEAIASFIGEVKETLRKDYDQLLLDIRGVVCDEGDVSESQQYPEAAKQIREMVDDLSGALRERIKFMSSLQA